MPLRNVDGDTRVMLITSRETQRWVIPKGWPMRKKTGFDTAALEAFEEAGLEGEISEAPLGSYRYEKRLSDVKSVTCEVWVFAMRVLTVQDSWPEASQRERVWLPPAEAAELVAEPALAALIRGITFYERDPRLPGGTLDTPAGP